MLRARRVALIAVGITVLFALGAILLGNDAVGESPLGDESTNVIPSMCPELRHAVGFRLSRIVQVWWRSQSSQTAKSSEPKNAHDEPCSISSYQFTSC
jgi:hypothetical protein